MTNCSAEQHAEKRGTGAETHDTSLSRGLRHVIR